MWWRLGTGYLGPTISWEIGETAFRDRGDYELLLSLA